MIKTGTTTYLYAVIEQHRRDGLSDRAITLMLTELHHRVLEQMKKEGVPPEWLAIEVERVMAKVMKCRQSHEKMMHESSSLACNQYARL
jgi:hypothetical protein